MMNLNYLIFKVWLGILVVLLATLISLKLITITSEGKIANNHFFSSKTVLNVVGLLLDKRKLQSINK